LPLEQRQVILLVGLEGMRYEEVAEVLNIPVGTVSTRLSRGRDQLRRLMDMTDDVPRLHDEDDEKPVGAPRYGCDLIRLYPSCAAIAASRALFASFARAFARRAGGRAVLEAAALQAAEFRLPTLRCSGQARIPWPSCCAAASSPAP
jgi:hypothetical protein